MQEAGRLKPEEYDWVGDQCGYTNLAPYLPDRKLLEGYRKVIETIYTPQAYFRRSLEAFCRLPYQGSLPRPDTVLPLSTASQ